MHIAAVLILASVLAASPGGVITHGYDAVQRRDYDDVQNTRTETDARGNATLFSLDAMGRLIGVRDALNRLATKTYADGAQQTFDYDANGNPTSLIDAKNQSRAMSYDALNRSTGTSYPAAGGHQVSSITRTLDANANATTQNYADGETDTTTQAFDDFDRSISRTDRYGNITTQGYDLNGNRSLLKTPQLTQYRYDGLNRLTSLNGAPGIIKLDYTPNSQRKSITYPNGASSEYAYDAAERIQDISHSIHNATLAEETYGYDANGNHTLLVQQAYLFGGCWAIRVANVYRPVSPQGWGGFSVC